MCRSTNHWGIFTGLICLSVAYASASEPIVQDFDGWKITIRPGNFGVQDLPEPASAVPRIIGSSAAIKLATLQEAAPSPGPAPGPSIDARPPISSADGLPAIHPADSDACCDQKPTVMPPEGSVDPRYLSQMYYEIYKSIPFIRAEYDANPSYLHDTSVEFLFGKMRPTVIHRGTTNVNNNYPSGYGVPYAYGGLGYAYPPLQLVVPGTGLRIHRLN